MLISLVFREAARAIARRPAQPASRAEIVRATAPVRQRGEAAKCFAGMRSEPSANPAATLSRGEFRVS